MPVHDWSRVRSGKFHHFHNAWIYRISDRLNSGILPAGFYAAGEQIVGSIEPDVVTFREPEPLPRRRGWKNAAGVLAVDETPPKVSQIMQADDSAWVRKQDSVAVRAADGDRLVALIEIVSRANKASRHELDRFLRKAASALDAGCHLVVIDLYLPGPFDPQGIHGQIWEYLFGIRPEAPRDRPLTLVSYRNGEPLTAYVEPIAVGAAMPGMPLFLDPDSYVEVPLEETYAATWRGVPPPWKRELEGERPPAIP